MPVILDHKKLSHNAFNYLSSFEKEFIIEITSSFHLRDGKQYPDGSLGSIKITKKELDNILSYVYTIGKIVTSEDKKKSIERKKA